MSSIEARTLITGADAALRRAKDSGGNRISSHQLPLSNDAGHQDERQDQEVQP